MRTPSTKTKTVKKLKASPKLETTPASKLPNNLKGLIAATTKLWRKSHLTYDQARYVSKEVRRQLGITRTKTRKRVVDRLSRNEEERLIQQAYKDKSEHGLLIKALFQRPEPLPQVSLREAFAQVRELLQPAHHFPAPAYALS